MRLLAVAVAAAAALLYAPLEALPRATLTAEAATELVRSVLPIGSTIQQATASTLPPGWISSDPSAVNVQVAMANSTLTVSFIPLDWVGVQSRTGTLDPIHYGEAGKVIACGAGAEFPGWLRAIAPNSASLATATGTTAFHVGGYPQAEASLRYTLRKSGLNREQIVASAINLGMPAEDLIRETAIDPKSPSRLAAIRSLRQFPGKLTREALYRIISDRSKDAAADRCRIAALDTCEALLVDDHGPSVLAALQVEKEETVAVRLADELNRLRFAPATAELRRWLKSTPSLEAKVSFARALATLKDTSAANDIRSALSEPTGRRAAVSAPATDATARRQLQIELLRLTGTWGPAQQGVRLALTAESPDRVLVHVENMGTTPFRFIPFPTAAGETWPVGLELTLDGQTISPPSPGDADLGRPSDICRLIAPSTAATFELHLQTALPQTVEHTVRATWFDLVANDLTLRADAAR